MNLITHHLPRVAVIGYGRWGRQCHAPLINLAPGLQLHGVASGDAQKRAAIESDLGVRAYQSFEAVIADTDVDVVVLATPNHTHADLAVCALEAGKHVVSDKVMCLSLAEYERMTEAAQHSDRLLTVFQNRRRDGDFMTLQRCIADGELGEVKWIEMAWQGLGLWGGWRGQAQSGGGRFYDLGAHLVDQMLLLFPQRVESVYCRMHFDEAARDIESEALLLIHFEGGCTGIIDTSSRAAISKPRFYAHGSEATFEKYGLDPQEDALKIGDIESAIEDPQNFARVAGKSGEKTVPTLRGRWRDFYENLADVLTQGAQPMVGLPELRRQIAVLEAGVASARSGEVVRLESS